jgi:hypothetical protein
MATLLATLLPCLFGCGHFVEVAQNSAAAQSLATSRVLAERDLVGGLCRAKADYGYYVMQFDERGPGERPLSRPRWYTTAAAEDRETGPVTFAAYCGEMVATARAYRFALESLQTYANALGALADDASFDLDGVRTLGESGGKLARELGSSSATAAYAKSAAAAGAELLERVVDLVRAGKLKKLVLRAGPTVVAAVEALDDYLATLEELAQAALQERSSMLRLAEQRVDGSTFSPASQAAFAFDAARDGDVPLRAWQAALSRDRRLLGVLARAYVQLGAAAVDKSCEASAGDAARELRRAIDRWDTDRWEAP